MWGNKAIVDENDNANTNDAPIVNDNGDFLVENSIVEGGYEGGRDIITDNPQFVDIENGKLRLEANSPALDRGINEISNTFEFDETDIDITGKSRISGDTVDIGAYEYRPYLTINDVEVVEGNEGITNAEFTVSLDDKTKREVTVDYQINDGTATGEDYTDDNGTLTFAPGDTEKTITVEILGDTTFEESEDFFVKLSNPSKNVEFADSRGKGTIENDDVEPEENNNNDNSGEDNNSEENDTNPEVNDDSEENSDNSGENDNNDLESPELNTIELFRFRNTSFESGTYVFVGAEERDGIQNDPNLNRTFSLEGVQPDDSINPAFKASQQPGDDLIPFYRLASLDNPGTFLFVGTQEYIDIFAENSDRRDKWLKEGLDTEDNDIPEFYLLDGSADRGIEFSRFRNTQNGTYLYAGLAETTDIENNPNLSDLFVNEGVAFESLI